MNERMTLEKEAKQYEATAKTSLTKKTPVFIRVDGKSFKTFTKGFDKPFDNIMNQAMQKAMRAMCEEAQGCVLGWTNSDEITIIVADYKNWNSSSWFDYEVQKMCSVAASTATLEFNREFSRLVNEIEDASIRKRYCKALSLGAKFDARCFNVPEDRVNDMIFWRQNDCRRNAIQSLARHHFERNEIIGKCNDEILAMLHEIGVEWNDIPYVFKHGACCVRRLDDKQKMKWTIDTNLPMFDTSDYIDAIMASIRTDEDEY